MRRERSSDGWDKALNPQKNDAYKMAEGKKAQISEASWFFMQSHSKENGKYIMIYNDITYTRNWTQVCHIYPA